MRRPIGCVRTSSCGALPLRIAVAATTLAAGCRHVAPPESEDIYRLGVPPIQLAPVDYEGTLPLQEIDTRWLDADDFIPPGARLILPAEPVEVRLRTTPGARFPSTDICVSPDTKWTLFSGGVTAGASITHWLMADAKGSAWPNTLFTTVHAFDVLWSGDSQQLAVTHHTGRNRSDVFIVAMRRLQRFDPLDLTPAVQPYFSALQLAAPRFLKAYRWTETGGLVVRGVGRLPGAPFDLFGYEVLVHLAAGDATRMEFVRGYTKPNLRARDAAR